MRTRDVKVQIRERRPRCQAVQRRTACQRWVQLAAAAVADSDAGVMLMKMTRCLHGVLRRRSSHDDLSEGSQTRLTSCLRRRDASLRRLRSSVDRMASCYDVLPVYIQ